MDRVLIVDDDTELCDLLKQYLASEGLAVETAHDGRRGVELALSGDYALVVLDVMLPALGGFDVLRAIRSESAIPVVMLTARGDDVDRIVGLELGADDYLPKPFNPRELVARIRAVLRRARGAATAPTGDLLTVGDVEIDRGSREAKRGSEQLSLTTAEFDLLDLLLRSAGRVVTRDDIAKAVLGREFTPFDRSIDMHVSNLRKKLGTHADGLERIKSVRSVGYLYTLPSRTKDE
jgi:two-component system, OmpR family, response regulator CpxR